MINKFVHFTLIFVFTNLLLLSCQPKLTKKMSSDESLSSLYAQNTLKTYETYRKAKVKTQTVYRVDENSNKTLLQITHFDTQGKTTKNENWSTENEIHTDYFYKNGLLQRETITGLNLDDYTINYEYDKNGQLIRQTISGAEARIYTFVYDEKGYMIEKNGQSALPEGDTLIWQQTEQYKYKYDENGNEISYVFEMYGEEYFKTISIYNAQNQRINSTEYMYGEVSFSTTYEYNNANLPIKATFTDADNYLIYEYEFY
jgi:YD repeat-containing protein